MTRTGRMLLVLAAPLVTIGCLWLAWTVLPGVHLCVSIYCGSHFDSGGVDVFGAGWFTLPQTIGMGLGIATGAYLLARGLLPRLLRWTSVGFGILVLASAIAIMLPSYITGSAPSVPCSTPGIGGPVVGRCQSGAPPTDHRDLARGSVLVVGVSFLFGGAVVDRRLRQAASSKRDSLRIF